MNETARRPQPATLSRFRIRGELPVPTLINGLTLTAVPLLLFFALRAARAGADPITAPLLLAFAVVLALNSLVYLLLGYPTLHRRTFITLITGLFVYLAVQAVEDGSAIIWLFAYPPVIFYISEARHRHHCLCGRAGRIDSAVQSGRRSAVPAPGTAPASGCRWCWRWPSRWQPVTSWIRAVGAAS